jgi:aspartate kinase
MSSLRASDILVKKFGGTSVGSIERIEHVADRLVKDFNRGQRFVVVASAMAGETNRLVKMANDIYQDSKSAAYDMLLASGEQVSIALLSMALQKRGLKARPYLAFQLGIQTDSIYSKAKITHIDTQKMLNALKEDEIPVIAGFQGIDVDSNITTLGRGGSDTTGVALAAALGSRYCEIYTDVDGVYTADPRVVPAARKIQALNYEEMMEMAALGSKVLHFRCVEIAAKYNVQIHVRSTFSEDEGTWIRSEVTSMEAPVVSAITHDAKIVVLGAEPAPNGVDFLTKLFKELSDKEVVVDIIAQAQGARGQRIAFSISDEDLAEGQVILKRIAPPTSEISVLKDVAKVSIVGVGMRSYPGVAARFFDVLSRRNIELHMVTTSDIKMSGVIPRERLEEAVRELHKEFQLDEVK